MLGNILAAGLDTMAADMAATQTVELPKPGEFYQDHGSVRLKIEWLSIAHKACRQNFTIGREWQVGIQFHIHKCTHVYIYIYIYIYIPICI